MREKLSQSEFESKLKEMFDIDKLYTKRWENYPRSIFYYDTSEIDGTTDNIGIYTNEMTYGLGSC